MKYKKRSLKKQRQRHYFSKKYDAVTAQRGGGFMDIIGAELIAIDGRMNTCIAVHPTQPLVVVGDDAGIVTLFEINQPQPKRVAQLMGLPTAVKCVEFHPTLPVVAAACSDKVLMWRFDQISREQEQQQVEPSHTVSVFGLRSEEEVKQELRATEQNLKENKEKQYEMFKEQVTINNNLRDIDKKRRDINDDQGRNGYPGFTRGADHLEKMLQLYTNGRNKEKELETLTKLEPLRQKLIELQAEEESMRIKYKESKARSDSINIFDIELKIKALNRELDLIRADARDEVSCIAFRPGSVNRNTMSYIAVGVNNDKNKTENRIIMYRFEIEPSYVEKLYSFSTILQGEQTQAPPEDVSLMSFSHNGALFAFVTKSLDDRTVLKVLIFKGSYHYYEHEYRTYSIEQSATSIRSYKSGRQDQHEFIIGCNNSSLLMTQATTETRGFAITKVTGLKNIREWNAGEPVNCVAVHPSLPLFASGTRSVAKLWDTNEPGPLKSFALQDVISVGFNQKFLAVCGRISMSFYSCNPDDYGGFKEELQKELKVGSEVSKYGAELALVNRQGEPCSICGDPMNDPLTQSTLRHGPEDAVEEYMDCGHTFHKQCIAPWIKQGKPCPLCRARGGLVKATPQRIVKGREELHDQTKLEQSKKMIQSITDNLRSRTERYEPRILFGQPAAAPESVALEAVAEPVAPVAASAELTPEQLRDARVAYFSKQQPPSENSGGGSKRNKYSRKKHSSKKSKIRRRYSKKYKY